MSLLWIVARAGQTAVEHLPVAPMVDPIYRKVWNPEDHPVMSQMLQRLRGDGGYDPERHGMLQARFDGEGVQRSLRLPAGHTFPGGENAPQLFAQVLEHMGHEHVPVMVEREKPPPTRESDPTRARVFYHGTTAEGDLDQILPASRSGAAPIYQHMTDPDYAYATTSKNDAWDWAQNAYHNTGGRPRVFKVRRRGPVEHDEGYTPSGYSRGISHTDVRSRHGFDVIGEEPMPRHMHDEHGEG